VTVLHRLVRLVIVLRSHRLTRAWRIFATIFLEDLLSSRFLETDRRRCIWRPDQSGADRDLLHQLELQLLYDPCVADWARCKQVTYAAGVAVAARAQALSPPYLSMVSKPGTGKGLSSKHKKQRRRYDNKRSSSLPPSCSPLHLCRSSSGGTGKRHRIEELSSPRRSYRDYI
jgi:hypothetical protein